jgi:hypothetical protein
MVPRNFCVRITPIVSTLTIAHLLLAFFSGTNLVVAEEKVRSLQYIETSGPISTGPSYVAQVMILDGSIKRMSLKQRPKEGFSTPEPAAPDSNDFFEIYDAKDGKRVYVFPDKREFVVVKGFKKGLWSGSIQGRCCDAEPQCEFGQIPETSGPG